jgi:hypothetical protein
MRATRAIIDEIVVVAREHRYIVYAEYVDEKTRTSTFSDFKLPFTDRMQVVSKNCTVRYNLCPGLPLMSGWLVSCNLRRWFGVSLL